MTFDGTAIMHDQALSPSQTRRRSSARRPLSEISNSPLVRRSLGKPLMEKEPMMEEEEPVVQAPIHDQEATKAIVSSTTKTDWSAVLMAIAFVAVLGFAISYNTGPVEVSPAQSVEEELSHDQTLEVHNVMEEVVDTPTEPVAEVAEHGEDVAAEPIEINFDETDEDWVYTPSEGFENEDEGQDEEYDTPWEAAIISGPIHLPELDEGGDWNGFARLTQAGELYLFDEPAADFPSGMIALDGCHVKKGEYLTSSPLCFPLTTNTRVLEACVGEHEEALDWLGASYSIAC